MGLLPHYIDYKHFKGLPNVIDICSGVENVVREIKSYDVIVTSSLHGIIASHFYDVKWAWVASPKNQVVGGEYKFRDFFSRFDWDVKRGNFKDWL